MSSRPFADEFDWNEYYDRVVAERRAGAERLDRLAISGTLIAMRPIRRRYVRDGLGLIAMVIAAIGFVALLMLMMQL